MVRILKKRLAMALAVTMLTTVVPQVVMAQDYNGHWAATAIAKWEEKGLVTGYEDGTFRPKNTITRAEFAQLLVRIFGYTDTVNAKVYEDVKGEAWYFDAVNRISDTGIMHEEGTNFRPNDPITREEAAYALANAYKVVGEATVSFKDQENISDWAQIQVKAMAANGHIKGTPEGNFVPQNTLTRAELVTMIDNMTSNVINVAGTYSEDVAGNLVVNTRDVELKDMVIEGNLYLGEGIGDGDIYLDNIEVKGQVIVEGGGINSIKSKNSKYHEQFVVSASNPVRVVIEGDAVKVEAMPGTTVTLTGNFADVIVAPNVNMTVKDATVETIIAAPATNPNDKVEVPVITIEGTAKVDKVQADAPVEVKGEGTVTNLVVNTEGVKIEQKPENVEISKDKDIVVNIGGKDETQDTVNKPSKPSTGGGGSSDSGNGGNTGGDDNNNHVCDTNKKVRISGQVTYENEGVGYATVNVYDKETGRGIMYGETDVEGYYTYYVPACKDYGIEAWVEDEDGYGYHVNNFNMPKLHDHKTVNLELIKKHVVNFKVVDKHDVPLHDIKIVPILDGEPNGWSHTNWLGEDTRYLWDENAKYGFKFYMGEELIYTIPESIQANEDFKQDIRIKVEEIGLDKTIEGNVVIEESDVALANTDVTLYEVIVKGAYETSYKWIETVSTDKNGYFSVDIPNSKKLYALQVRTKTEEGHYYAGTDMDARLAKKQGLPVKRSYGVEISTFDKDGAPLPNVDVKVYYSEHSWSSTNTKYDGKADLFNYYMGPGQCVVEAKYKDEVLVHGFEMVEGTYNYNVDFKFEGAESEYVPVKVKFDTLTVMVGDKKIQVAEVGIQGRNEDGNGWGQWTRVDGNEATILIPKEYTNEEVELIINGPNGVQLYRENNIPFAGQAFTKEVKLQDIPRYGVQGEVYLDGQVTTGAAISINMPGWGMGWTEVGQPENTEDGFVQENLVEGTYFVRAEVTTDGALYLGTGITYASEGWNWSKQPINLYKAQGINFKVVDENGNPLSNVELELHFDMPRDEGSFWYNVATNSAGEVQVTEGVPDNTKVRVWIRRLNGISYETIEGDFVIDGDNNTFVVVGRPRKEN